MTNGDKKTSLIEWIEVNKRPNNASYILLKIIEPEYKETICIPGSYEDGRFWDVLASSHIEYRRNFFAERLRRGAALVILYLLYKNSNSIIAFPCICKNTGG